MRNRMFSRKAAGGGGVKLWSDGRTAIASILDDLESCSTGKKVCFLPEYTCDTVILPFEKYHYRIYFYRIRENLCIDEGRFAGDLEQYCPDVVLLHPYYGSDHLDRIYEIINRYKAGKKIAVIEDLTQSLFLYRKAAGRADYLVCSLRKWFAIPDGGFSMTAFPGFPAQGKKVGAGEPCADYIRTKRSAQRLKRRYLDGDFVEKKEFLNQNRAAEQMLYGQEELCRISEYAEHFLKNAGIFRMKEQRRKNAGILREELKRLKVRIAVDFDEEDVPLYLPVYVDDRYRVQEQLRKRGIYAPVLWPVPEQAAGCISREAEYIYGHLLALPCDHRYDERDMLRISYALENL